MVPMSQIPATELSPDNAPLTIDVVSDVVCPWCFIGKHRLEKAIASVPEIAVDVRYHPYFLNDWIPRQGLPRADYLTAKFGSVAGYKDIAQRVGAAAAAEGLDYAVDRLTWQPNTLDSHRLIHWAREIGAASAMKQRLMDLYFTKGANLNDADVLVQAAVDCGLDADTIRNRLTSDTDVDTVTAEAERAKAAGVQGVPHFIIGGLFAVSGAQPPELLLQVIARAKLALTDPDKMRELLEMQ